MLSLFERNIWLSAAVAAGLAVLLLAALVHVGGRWPELKPLPTGAPPPVQMFLQGDEQGWLAVESVVRTDLPTNVVNPFYTLHFQPPPPPPTKKVTLQYQGCFVSSKGVARAYVLLEKSLLILTNGARVVADHAISDIGLTNLTLTNAGTTNVLKFRAKTVLEVPAS